MNKNHLILKYVAALLKSFLNFLLPILYLFFLIYCFFQGLEELTLSELNIEGDSTDSEHEGNEEGSDQDQDVRIVLLSQEFIYNQP